jgi:hypothetical protein
MTASIWTIGAEQGLGRKRVEDVSSPALAVLEIIPLPVRLWVTAPGAHSASLALPGSPGLVVLTTSRRRYAAASARGEATFGPRETLALLVAAEARRARGAELVAWAERKLREPGWALRVEPVRLEHARRDDGAAARPTWWAGDEATPGHWLDPTHGWSLGRLAGWYGARLVEVTVEDDASPTPKEARSHVS